MGGRAAREPWSLSRPARGLGLDAEPPRHTDLDDLAGTWVDDPVFDRVIREMDRVDEEMWK